MTERTLSYFVADVHLGLGTKDPREREERFVTFLKNLPRERMQSLWLLGDIWDFWYEYRDVIPREGIRVVSELIQLMDAGVEVYFLPGNHDIWCYSFFESIGMHKISQPHYAEIGGRVFCVGHGDCLGGARRRYRFMLSVFRCRPIQVLFSTLHPWIAYRFGLCWSNSNRRTHKPYTFRGADEPLYRFAVRAAAAGAALSVAPAAGAASAEGASRKIDYFIFGHFHDSVDLTLPGGERLLVVKDWLDGGEPCVVFDASSNSLSVSR